MTTFVGVSATSHFTAHASKIIYHLNPHVKKILFFLCWHFFFWRGVYQYEGWLINCTIVTVTATATSQVMHIVQYSVTLLVTTPDSHSIDYSPTCHKSSLSQQWNHLSICLQEHDALVSSPFPLHGR